MNGDMKAMVVEPKKRTARAIEKINLQEHFLPLVRLKWDCSH